MEVNNRYQELMQTDGYVTATKLKDAYLGIGIKQELYPEEYGRKFTTEKAGFQVVKVPTNRMRLVLAIDRKPIAELFKKQFDKLRQSIHRPIQPQRKSRRMKI